MVSMGFPTPTHTPSFLAVGRLDENKVIGKNQSGILFISWRCLYATLVDGRIEDKKPDLTAAFNRTLYLIIARLTRYGEKWLKWRNINKNTNHKHMIPKKHQNKIVITQTDEGKYKIHHYIFKEFYKTNPSPPMT
jgi:hypothetical protein